MNQNIENCIQYGGVDQSVREGSSADKIDLVQNRKMKKYSLPE
jgi:hypothetical protein